MSGPPTYETMGIGYSAIRRPDPRIAAAIEAALGDASTVVNVGAGTGAYEPAERAVIAVEPSPTMIAQRRPGSASVIRGAAEHLPLPDRCADAALAVFTIFHWEDLGRGLDELRRVAHRVVIVTMDEKVVNSHWLLADYLPELVAHTDRLPSIEGLIGDIAGSRSIVVPVPADCTDLFFAASWARPELYLDPAVRQATSPWHQVAPEAADRALRQLRADLADGTWDRRHGHLRHLAELDVGLRIIATS